MKHVLVIKNLTKGTTTELSSEIVFDVNDRMYLEVLNHMSQVAKKLINENPKDKFEIQPMKSIEE